MTRKKTLARVGRVLVSVLLIAYVLTRIPFSDRPGVEVHTRDGRTIVGEVKAREGGSVVLQPRVGRPVTLQDDEVESEKPALVEPGMGTVLRQSDLGLLLPLSLLWFIPLFITSHRWTLLLRVVGVQAKGPYVFRLAYIGVFFNNFMLGSTGGDLLKAILVARDTDLKTRAVASIVVDRVIGMAALALVALGAICLNLERPEIREAAVIIGSLLAALVLGTVVYFNPFLRSRPWIAAVLRRLPFEKIRQELDTAFQLYKNHRMALAYALAISLFSHFSAMVMAWGYSRAVGVEESVSLVHFCSYVPVIMIFAALPISVGGLGVGEAAYVRLFGPVGMSAAEAVTISLLGRLTNLLLSLPGGVLLATGRDRKEIAEARREIAQGDLAPS